VRTDITVGISAPPAVVWAVLSDVASWPEWTASVTSVCRLSSGRRRVGSRVRLKQPGLPATVWTVSDPVAGEQFSWTADSPGCGPGPASSDEPTRSQATLRIDQGGVLGSVVGLLCGGLTRRYPQLAAAGLQQRAEEPPAQHRV
jgi:hypothetical protein